MEDDAMSKQKKEKKDQQVAETKAAKKAARKPKEENLVVFAFRLAPEERDAIHAASGPGGASRFVRAVAIAAAREDDTAYKAAIAEARKLRE